MLDTPREPSPEEFSEIQFENLIVSLKRAIEEVNKLQKLYPNTVVDNSLLTLNPEDLKLEAFYKESVADILKIVKVFKREKGKVEDLYQIIASYFQHLFNRSSLTILSSGFVIGISLEDEALVQMHFYYDPEMGPIFGGLMFIFKPGETNEQIEVFTNGYDIQILLSSPTKRAIQINQEERHKNVYAALNLYGDSAILDLFDQYRVVGEDLIHYRVRTRLTSSGEGEKLITKSRSGHAYEQIIVTSSNSGYLNLERMVKSKTQVNGFLVETIDEYRSKLDLSLDAEVFEIEQEGRTEDGIVMTNSRAIRKGVVTSAKCIYYHNGSRTTLALGFENGKVENLFFNDIQISQDRHLIFLLPDGNYMAVIEVTREDGDVSLRFIKFTIHTDFYISILDPLHTPVFEAADPKLGPKLSQEYGLNSVYCPN